MTALNSHRLPSQGLPKGQLPQRRQYVSSSARASMAPSKAPRADCGLMSSGITFVSTPIWARNSRILFSHQSGPCLSLRVDKYAKASVTSPPICGMCVFPSVAAPKPIRELNTTGGIVGIVQREFFCRYRLISRLFQEVTGRLFHKIFPCCLESMRTPLVSHHGEAA